RARRLKFDTARALRTPAHALLNSPAALPVPCPAQQRSPERPLRDRAQKAAQCRARTTELALLQKQAAAWEPQKQRGRFSASQLEAPMIRCALCGHDLNFGTAWKGQQNFYCGEFCAEVEDELATSSAGTDAAAFMSSHDPAMSAAASDCV